MPAPMVMAITGTAAWTAGRTWRDTLEALLDKLADHWDQKLEPELREHHQT